MRLSNCRRFSGCRVRWAALRTAGKDANVDVTMANESDIEVRLAEIDDRIASVTDDLRELSEQAAAYSGAADEELASERIAEREAELERLTKQRDELTRGQS